MTVTAKPTAAPPGELVRAWLPIPRRYPFQDDFELLASSPPVRQIDSEESPIRCVYLEQPAKKDTPTRFRIEYEYTAHAVSFDIKPAEVHPCDPNDPTLKRFLAEAPHVVFTPEMRALSQKIVGDETNPDLKAKKCFDWIAGNIKYSFALEYSTMRNISDYCRAKGYGDCGQEALLFITLCRLNGVPARWQSGWNTFPGDKDIHDWTEIYLDALWLGASRSLHGYLGDALCQHPDRGATAPDPRFLLWRARPIPHDRQQRPQSNAQAAQAIHAFGQR